MEPGGTRRDVERDRPPRDPVIDIVREVHASMLTQGTPRDPNDVLAEEVAKVTKHHVPDVDPPEFREIHLRYLRAKDALIASGLKEEQLARRLNELARRTQREIARRMGRERYERLMGLPADEEVDLIAPYGVAAAGVPVPAQEEIREQAPAEPDPGDEPEREPSG